MKKILSFCLLMLLLLSIGLFANAQSAYDLISTHQKWMREYYPKGENLEIETLFKEVAFSVFNKLQEPEAKDLLRYAEKFVPQLETYLDWLDNKQAYTSVSIQEETLAAIAAAAKVHLGEIHSVTFWCRYLYLSMLGISENVIIQTDELIVSLQKAIRIKPDIEIKALLCIVKLFQFNNHWSENMVDDSQDYEDLLLTEHEALALYPAVDETVNHTRAFLYFMLAETKSRMSHLEELKLVQERVGLMKDTPYNERTSTGKIDNVAFYYDKAWRLYRHLYTDGHPETMMVYMARNNYAVINYDMSENVEKTCRDIQLYADTYYSSESLESLMAHIDLWMCRWRKGLSNNDAVLCFSMLDKIKENLDENTSSFINFFANIVLVAVYDYPIGADRLLDEFDRTVERVFKDSPLKKAYVLSWVYFSVIDGNPKRAIPKLEQVNDLYKRYHNASILSLALGRMIVFNNNTLISNLNVAIDIQEYVCEDAKALYGKDSSISLNEELNLLILRVNSKKDNKSFGIEFRQLIERMKNQGANYGKAMMNYAEYMYGIGDFMQSELLYRELIENNEVEKTSAQRVNLLLKLVLILGNTLKGNYEECEKLYKQARILIEQRLDTESIWVENYKLAADYLIIKGHYKDALGMLDCGINLCLNLNGDNIFDSMYLDLHAKKISLLYRNLNDMVTAKRLMIKQLEDMYSNRDVAASTVILDYLWQCYYIFKEEGFSDFIQLYSILIPIAQSSQVIYIQSGQDQTFLMDYMAPLLLEFVEIFSMGKKVMTKNMMKNEDIVLFEQRIADMKSLFPLIKDIFQKMEQSILNSNNNYRRSARYHNIIKGQLLYYKYLEPDSKEALRYLELYRYSAEEFPDNLSVQLNIGDLYIDFGKYKEAISVFEKIYQLLRTKHKLTARDNMLLLSRLCSLYAIERKWDDLLESSRMYYTFMKEILDANFQMMTEHEQNNFMETYQDPAIWLTYLLEHMPEKVSSEVYDAVLYRTGMQLRSQRRTREAIVSSQDIKLIRLMEQLNQLQLERKFVTYDYKFEGQQLNQLVKDAGGLDFKINALEQQIIELSEPYRKGIAMDVSWKRVRDKLKKDEVAIEFVFSHEHIMALILKHDCKMPIPVQLASHKQLMESLGTLDSRTSAKMAIKLYNERAVDLYAMLWTPLEEHLNKIKTVYYTVTGILNNLSFVAFQAPDGNYLVDKYDLCQLTSTSILLRPKFDEQPHSALLMGNIFYSEKQQQLAKIIDSEQFRGIMDDFSIDDFDERGVNKDHFKYLPFTNNELEEITEEMKHIGWKNCDIVVRKGMDASEQAFKELSAKKPAIVHLATHGFFVSNSKQARSVPFYRNRDVDNSMYRAGVALANAEAVWCGKNVDKDENDGILTADEVSRLDLQNTQLVVLSACETALGDYSYEGVFGLPRGFKQAGVNSLLVSLWSVNDHSTSLLMTSFYRNWFMGFSKREALRQAVGEVRKVYPQPFYWAPFVLFDAN